MYWMKLIGAFMRASAQEELAYRENFWMQVLHSLLNLGVGVLGMSVLFAQVRQISGWDYASALAILGVYLVVSALRGLFIGPSLEALAGLGQEIWNGQFDFTLLRPANTRFLVTFRRWRFFALFDLLLGVGVLAAGVTRAQQPIGLENWLLFGLALLAAVVLLYAALLAFTSLAFQSPGMVFTWVFDAVFQLARYPVQIYPPALRFALTWLVPVGMMTSIPAQALTGQLNPWMLAGGLALAAAMLVGASWVFDRATRRYASASS